MTLNMVITSASRKGGLIRAFQRALAEEDRGEVIAIDASPYAAAVITDLAYNRSYRLAMSQAGHLLVDGFGCEQVINSMEEQ